MTDLSINLTHMAARPAKMSDADVAAAARLRALWNARARSLGLTQEKMGDTLDMGQSAVSHYLRGRMPLNYFAVVGFAKALQCKPEEIRSDLPEQTMMAPAKVVEVDPALHQGFHARATDMVFASLVHTLVASSAPAVKRAFVVYLMKLADGAKPRRMRTDKGLIRDVFDVLDIDEEVAREWARASPPALLRGPARSRN